MRHDWAGYTRAVVAVLLAALMLRPALGQGESQINLPEIGDASGAGLSSAEDKRLGEDFLNEIHQHLNVIDDPLVQDYIDALGYKLVAASGDSEQAFTFIPISGKDINAFAGPGGVVAVFSGLILATRTESELAAVVAHEIAHVTQRHLARQLQAGSLNTLKTAAGILAAILVGTQNPNAGAAAAAAVTANSVQNQLNFSRGNEKEADRVGMGTLVRANLDPRAMPLFFERLQQEYRYFAEPPEFLSTHPVTVARIADSRARAEQFPYKQFGDSFGYHLVKARLAVAAEPNTQKAIAIFAERRASGRGAGEIENRYGYTLALMRDKRWREAGEELAWLLDRHPEEVAFLDAAARIQVGLNLTDQAARIYREGLAVYSNDRTLVRGYARMLIDLGDYRHALKILRGYTAGRGRPDAQVFKLMAEAYERIGDKMSAHATLAEHDYLNGNLEAAILQLGRAKQSEGGDYYRREQVDARLKQFEERQALRKDE